MPSHGPPSARRSRQGPHRGPPRSALLLGLLSPPASAAAITTECRLQAQNTPTTWASPPRSGSSRPPGCPTRIPPSPFGLVTFFDGLPILGTSSVERSLLVDSVQGQRRRLLHHQQPVGRRPHDPRGPRPGPDAVSGRSASANHRVNPPPAQPSSTGVASSANPSKLRAERDVHARRSRARAAAPWPAPCSSRPTATTWAVRRPWTAAATPR